MLPITQSKPPKQLGRFEVGAKIGGGGMATVYLGRDVRDDGTEALVALKVIRDELANDEQFAAMFVDEAKILARLSHPNVIQTLEYGVTGQHRFIAMELLTGGPSPTSGRSSRRAGSVRRRHGCVGVRASGRGAPLRT